MVRSKEANQRIRTEQRKRILDAARIVFARKGLAATMDDIAERAGVSHGLAYRYFDSKTALFSDLVLEDLREPTGWLDEFVEEKSAPIDKIRQMITGFVEGRREHPERYHLLAQVLFDESAPIDLRRRVAQRGQIIRAVLRRLIISGQNAGEIASGDPDQLVRAVFAALDGLTALHRFDPATYRVDFPDAEILMRMLKP